MKKTIRIALFSISFLLGQELTSAASSGESSMSSNLSPDEVENQIKSDQTTNPLYESKLLVPIRTWKKDVADRTDFNWSLDYSALFMWVDGSPGEDQASGGMV